MDYYTDEERVAALLASATRNGVSDSLRADLGNPATFADALAAWKRLRENSKHGLDRLDLELKYGDEIEW